MITASNLSNIPVGGKWNNVVSLRFKALSSPLAAARLYWVIGNPPGRPGYMAGNGGAYSYSLHDDSGGIPSSAGLQFSSELTIDQLTQNKLGNFPLICFSPTRLIPGQFYHLVVQNTALLPQENFASLNFLENNAVLNQTPDVQVLVLQTGAGWRMFPQFLGSPVALFYSDGAVAGYGYYQVGPNGLLGGEAYGFPKSICP